MHRKYETQVKLNTNDDNYNKSKSSFNYSLIHPQTARKAWVRTQLSTVATDAPVLNHQATSAHSAEKIFLVVDHFRGEILHIQGLRLENEITFKNPVVEGFTWPPRV